MGLRLKILLGFLILAVMLLIAGIWSIYELNSVGSSVQNLLDENYKSISAAKMMLEALEREDSAVLLLMMGNWREGRSIIASGDSLFERGFFVASNNITIAGERSAIDAIRKDYDAYKAIWEKPIVDTSRQGDLNWYFESTHQQFQRVKAAVNDLMTLNDRAMFQTASHLENKASRAIMPGIVAIIAALAFSLIFTYFVNYYMVTPIVAITGSIKQYIEKRQAFNIDIETHDELADLANAIQILCAHDNNAEKER